MLVTEAYHPFWQSWWPHGHIIGWEHTFVHEIPHLLDAIANDRDVAPHGATFEDGYRAAEICDAISARPRPAAVRPSPTAEASCRRRLPRCCDSRWT